MTLHFFPTKYLPLTNFTLMKIINELSYLFILSYLDYLNLCQSKNKRRTPTCLNFCEALLMEILCNMSPDNKLWDKVKYAAFLLNLANRNVKFDLLYKIFCQVNYI